MIREGQKVFVKLESDYIDGIVEEIIKEGSKKYYGVSGFAEWLERKDIFETERETMKACNFNESCTMVDIG